MIVFKKYQIYALFVLMIASFAGLLQGGADASALTRGWSSISSFGDKVLKHPATPYLAAPAALYAGIKLSSLPCIQSETSYPLWALRSALYTLPSLVPSEIARYQRETLPQDDRLWEKPYKGLFHLSGPTLTQMLSLLALNYYSPSYSQAIHQAISIPPIALTHIYSLIRESINDEHKYNEREREEQLRKADRKRLRKKVSEIYTKEIELPKEFAHKKGLLDYVNSKHHEIKSRLAKLTITPEEIKRKKELWDKIEKMPKQTRAHNPDFKEWQSLRNKIEIMEAHQEVAQDYFTRFRNLPPDQWEQHPDYKEFNELVDEKIEIEALQKELLEFQDSINFVRSKLQEIQQEYEKVKQEREQLLQDEQFKDEYEEILKKPSAPEARKKRRKAKQESQEQKPFSEYYDILGISSNASHEEVRTAYLKLAKKYHPDKNPGNKDAESKFKEVQAAYQGLLRHFGLK